MEKRDVIYSENGKVSLRQTYRMLFLEIFGISSLILPAPLAKICQNDGIFAILAAGVLWYFILRLGIFVQKRADYFSGADAVDSGTDSLNRSEVLPDAQRIAEESSNSCGKNIKGTLQGVIFAIAGGFLLYILTSLVENQLLDTGYLWIVVLTLLFAGGYGIIRGIECRARIYEILFWILVIPLVIVLILAAFEVKSAYWLPVFFCGWKQFFLGVMLSMAAFSPAAVSFFFFPSCARPEGLQGAATFALGSAVFLNVVLYMQLLGVFRWKFLSELRFPVISLMAVVQFPGDFFERQDALMTAIWFFCLFALFHSLCHYATAGFLKLFKQEKREMLRKKCTAGIMLAVLAVGMLFLLNGCGRREPEESMYPLAIGVEMAEENTSQTEENTNQMEENVSQTEELELEELKQAKHPGMLQVCYAWPQSGGDSGETETPKGDMYEKTEADSLFTAQQIVSENTDKTLDFHHLKLLALDVSVLQNEQQMKQLLEYFRENENMAWNTCVVAMDGDMDVLFSDKTSLEKPLGMYVAQMLNGREELKRDAVVTVKDLMNLYENQIDTVLIPQLMAKNGKPVLSGLRICQRGTDKGMVQTQETADAYLLLEQAREVKLRLGDGTDVTVQDIRVERQITERQTVSWNQKNEGKTVENDKIYQQLVIKGNLKLPESRKVTPERGREICQETESLLQERLQALVDTGKTKHQADLTGSFGLLAGLDRTLYKQYETQPELYEERLYTQIKVRLKQLNV